MLPIGFELTETYRVTRLLGQGGMACVYEVAHVRLPSRMAAKVITGDLGNDPNFLQRFRQEAEILARLRHPHVVHVSDWNVTKQGHPYLIMELLEGEDLSQRLRRSGAIPIEEALPIFLQISDALQAAHDQDIVHRDLKPANVFLLSKGAFRNYVKVLDFGIAKAINTRSGPRTKNAEILGTPAYMAPEQVRGVADSIGVRADQFALALVLYEMLAGRAAFYLPGDDMLQTLARVLLEEPPPLTQYPQLDTVLRRALNKDPESRFPSIRDFVTATGAMDLSVVRPLLAHTRPLPLVTAPLSQECPANASELRATLPDPEGPQEKHGPDVVQSPLRTADAPYEYEEGETLKKNPGTQGTLVSHVEAGRANRTSLRSASLSRPSITGQKILSFMPTRWGLLREAALFIPLLVVGGAAWSILGNQEQPSAYPQEDLSPYAILADAGSDPRIDAGVLQDSVDGAVDGMPESKGDAGANPVDAAEPAQEPRNEKPVVAPPPKPRRLWIPPPRQRVNVKRIIHKIIPASPPGALTPYLTGTVALDAPQKSFILGCVEPHLSSEIRSVLLEYPLELSRAGGSLVITSEQHLSEAVRGHIERCLRTMSEQMSVPQRVTVSVR